MAPQIKYTKLFINNEWVDAQSGKTFDTRCPHDGTVIASVAEGDKADIDLAVSAAKRAFNRNSEWRLMDASDRGRILTKFADLVKRDAQYLAELEFLNNGMVLNVAIGIKSRIDQSIRYLASLADKIQGATIPAVVVKPAEQTPLTALYLAALLAEAGVPKGVVNVVNGFGMKAGVALTHHPDVAKISFTGSMQVGKLIQQAAGLNNLKRVTLELGGKSPLIIMDDADSASRLYVHSKIYDKFIEAAIQFAKNIKIGDPKNPTTQHGPQIDATMFEKVMGYIEKGKTEGAKLVQGGKRIGNTGYYIEPTIFVDVQDHMSIAKDEIFGPVQSILKFDTLEEAIERANGNNYGLGAGIVTKNINNALQFSKHVEAGVVWVNTYLASAPQLPFGGFKESGVGRENGLDCIDAYLEVKTVTMALPKKI